ncbi:MAG: hypothetical protein ACE5HB_00200 [Terriglobia bacterium]
MEEIASDRLATYVVWLPVLNFQDARTLQRNTRKESRRLPGPRSLHYADPEGYAGHAYSKIMEIPYGAPAWDMYFAFGPDAEWKDGPPAPDYWEHQLGGMPPGKRLNGPRFAERVRRLLAQAVALESELLEHAE